MSERPPLHRQPGDGWVQCACGSRHWGLHGAAGLLLRRQAALSPDGRDAVVLQHRALWSDQGGTWGVPGGAVNPDETAAEGAVREAVEEAGLRAEAVQPLVAVTLDHGPWSYTTVLADLRPEHADLTPGATDPESLDVAWVAVEDVTGLPLMPAFAEAWPVLRGLLDGRRAGGVGDPGGGPAGEVGDVVMTDARGFDMTIARWWAPSGGED